MEIGLVLGGGGARGFAHVGAYQALTERGYTPVAIAGCSMGAILGAFYASGHTSEGIIEIIEKLSFFELVSSGERGGLVGGKRIARFLAKYLPETFEELTIPLQVTAVDVQEGTLSILRSGELVPALMASSALPGLLSPVPHQGRMYVDGGLLNNVPVDIIRTMTLAPVVAVDVSAPPNRTLEFESRSLLEQLTPLLKGQKGVLDQMFRRALTIELFMKSFDIPQKVLTDMRLSLQPPELLIRPTLPSTMGVEDFDKSALAKDIGYKSTVAALEQWPAEMGHVQSGPVQ